MEKLRIAVLGAGGIGKYHIREFRNCGCEVVAILGSSKESSEKTASDLYASLGVNVKPYYEIEKLLETEKLDAVSICTPLQLHELQVRKCLEFGVHVLCEKPFVLNSLHKNYKSAYELVKLAQKKRRILSVNTQWPAVLPYLSKYADLSSLRYFSVLMEPGLKGADMLTDHLPHANSILVRLVKSGKMKNIEFSTNASESIKMGFEYFNKAGKCRVEYLFRFKADRPRAVVFLINEKKFAREIGKNYEQRFVCDGNRFSIEDPFSVSIRSFVNAIIGKGKPLISEKEILENVKLQDKIIKMYIQSQ